MLGFLDLPLEIRLKVYNYIPVQRVFCRRTSPFDATVTCKYQLIIDDYSAKMALEVAGLNTSQIAGLEAGQTLESMGIKGDINLSLLFSNKTISRELSSLLTFYVGTPRETRKFLSDISSTITPRFFPRIEKLEIDVSLLWAYPDYHAASIITTLCDLKKNGSFQELSLIDDTTIDTTLCFGIEEVVCSLANDSSLAHTLTTSFEQALCACSQWLAAISQHRIADLPRIKIVLNSLPAREYSPDQRQNELDFQINGNPNRNERHCAAINSMLRAIHATTAGELWVEHYLVWKNLEQVRRFDYVATGDITLVVTVDGEDLDGLERHQCDIDYDSAWIEWLQGGNAGPTPACNVCGCCSQC